MKSLYLLVSVIFTTAAPGALAWPGCEEDVLGAVVSGDTLTVYHDAATYNCCMDGVEYTVAQDDSSIQIQETEIVPIPCACLCCYDVSVQVVDLAPGTYTLVFTWDDYDTGQWEDWTEEIIVLGNGQGGPTVATATNSGCIDPAVDSEFGIASDSWGRVRSLYR